MSCPWPHQHRRPVRAHRLGPAVHPVGHGQHPQRLVPLFTFLLAAVVLRDEAVTPARLGGLVVGLRGRHPPGAAEPRGRHRRRPGRPRRRGHAGRRAGRRSPMPSPPCTRDAALTRPAARRGRRRTARCGRRRAHEIALGSTLVGLRHRGGAGPRGRAPGGRPRPPARHAGAAGSRSSGWALLGTGLAYLLFFGILERWGATRTTLVTYVLPVVAITLGFVFLGERLRPHRARRGVPSSSVASCSSTASAGSAAARCGSAGRHRAVEPRRERSGGPRSGGPARGLRRLDAARVRGRLYAGTSASRIPSWSPRFYAPGRASRRLLRRIRGAASCGRAPQHLLSATRRGTVASWLARGAAALPLLPQGPARCGLARLDGRRASRPPGAPLAGARSCGLRRPTGCRAPERARGSLERDDDGPGATARGAPDRPAARPGAAAPVLGGRRGPCAARETTTWRSWRATYDGRDEPDLRRIGPFLYLRLRRSDLLDGGPGPLGGPAGALPGRWAGRLRLLPPRRATAQSALRRRGAACHARGTLLRRPATGGGVRLSEALPASHAAALRRHAMAKDGRRRRRHGPAGHAGRAHRPRAHRQAGPLERRRSQLPQHPPAARRDRRCRAPERRPHR